MRVPIPAVLTALLLTGAPAAAQTVLLRDQPADAAVTSPAPSLDGAQPAAPPPLETPRIGPSGSSFLGSMGRDFRTFFTAGATARTLGATGAVSVLASRWDDEGARTARNDWSADAFEPGRMAGNFLTHVAAGGGTYLLGRVTGRDEVARFGNSLIRAQILSQAVVQAGKLATQRDRPDGSNHHSLPSGHTATAFASATVVQRHFGWKAGIPAYAFAGYVGASRMAANRHYLSDVILGAGIGVAAAHTVTLGVGAQRFDVGVAPAQGGGAMVTFSKQ